MSVTYPPRRGEILLPGRGPGAVATWEFGPAEREVDLVFLHANGFNAFTYRTLLAPLGADLRVLAYDQRGHGRTTLAAEPRGRRDWLDLRDDLLAVLETLSGAPVLAGHSLGGAVSLLAAAEAPRRVGRLALIDPVIAPIENVAAGTAGSEAMDGAALRRRAHFPSRAAAVEAYAGRGAFRTWPAETIADFAEDGVRDLADGTVELACAPAWEASNYAAQGHDPWDAFARSTCPIHILRAERDSTCRVDGRAADLTASGRIRLKTAPGTSHFLPMERPDLAGAALRAACDTEGGRSWPERA